MAAVNRPARLNRTLLAVIGLVLLAGGAGLAALGLGLLHGVVPGLDPSVPLLPGQVSPPTWVAYLTIAVAVVVGLLCLRWLLAQAQRRPAAGTWALPAAARPGVTDTGTTRIGTADVADAVVADVSGYAGVEKAIADLVGDRARPTLELRVTASRETSAGELRRRIHDHALPRLCQALDVEHVDTHLVLALDAAPPARAR